MAQQQIGGLAAIAAYTVDSDFESDDEADKDKNEDSKHELLVVKEEKIDIDENLQTEVKAEDNGDERTADFGDLYIKEEPMWVEDKEGAIDPVVEFNELQEIKVEIESEAEEVSSSSDDSDSSDDEEVVSKVIVQEEEKENTGPVRTKNEITHKDLPPVEDLEIRVAVVDCLKVGVVSSTIEELVVVESIPDMPALDLETVLFTKTDDLSGLTLDLKAVGRVFDVIGPVTRPYYVIRFNTQEHLDSKEVKIGQDIFFAPKSEHTSFVFLEQLMKMKISDASWTNDEEPPSHFLEYSDDEQETRTKQERKIARMVEKGVEPSEVEAKKARIQRGRDKNNERNNQPRNNERNNQPKNNEQHNQPATVDKRHNNGLYSAEVNPFYRQNRRYDPRDNGAIKWTDYNTQSTNQPNMNYNHNNPTPNYPTSTNYPNYYQSSYAVPPPGWPPVNSKPTPAVQSGGWQTQYNHQSPAQQSFASLWQPPPPPPPQ